MNNKEVMVGCIKEAWLLYEPDMDAVTFSIASTGAVMSVLGHLMNEQLAHDKTKQILKERISVQDALEVAQGAANQAKCDAQYAEQKLRDKVNQLQSEIDRRQTVIETLEADIERIEGYLYDLGSENRALKLQMPPAIDRLGVKA